MIALENEAVGLRLGEAGRPATIEDRRRRQVWEQDPACSGFSESAVDGWLHEWPSAPLTPLPPGEAERLSDTAAAVTHPLPGGDVRFTWRLLDDGVDLRVRVRSDRVRRVSQPGAFRPARGGMELLIPADQGILVRNCGAEFDQGAVPDRTTTLSMIGYRGERGALLAVQEDIRDRFLWYGRRGGALYAFFEVAPCAVAGWYERALRLYVTDRSLTAVAKRHRRRIIERGDFVGWDEKIRRKPAVAGLFGCLIAFIGYNQGRRTDYAAGARALRDMGFERVLYYPVRFNAMVRDFRMGGDPPIWLSDEEMAAMREAGGLLAPWTWSYDALDNGDPAVRAAFRLDPAGRPVRHWQIDEQKWYCCCTGSQLDFVRAQYAGPMREMDWNHYDVSAGNGGWPCFAGAHAAHAGRPLTAREDRQLVGRLLSPGVNGNRIVSSEVFNEFCAQQYDLGSNKRLPAWGGEAQQIPVPLTGLVFHDSTVHHWWELHVYNDLSEYDPAGRPDGPFASGQPEKRAAMDALYGCPPLVFPFGRQYGWVDIDTFRSFSFEVEPGSAAVQRALRAALPVARLHGRIGRQEMTSFEFLSEDCAVQATAFADGTRVVANIGDQPRTVDGVGRIEANQWRVTPA